MPTQRQLRVNALLHHEIADIVRRDLADPDIGFITITGVEVSADLRHARVFLSVLGDEQATRRSMGAVIRARKVIRGLLGDRLDMRYVPELTIKLDDTAERAQRMETLLREVAEGDEDDGAEQ